MAKKSDAKAFALRKRRRRQWITFVRMVRYGVNNFSRNAWLTIAATAVMTITLLIIFMTLVARNTLQATVDSIGKKVDMSIYLNHDVTESQVKPVMAQLKGVPSVRGVSYQSPSSLRTDSARHYSTNSAYLKALSVADDTFPAVIHVNLAEIDKTDELKRFVKDNQDIQPFLNPNLPPSFDSNNTAIKTIGSWISFADRAGLIGTIIFIAISTLIVFNTIRMAIFNRREEIQMMKLIGADRSFIRGPFIVEAIVYGFVAAILATGLGYLALVSVRDKLVAKGVAIGATTDNVTTYIGFVLLAMILIGAFIGVISSLLATRRYLKI